MATLIVCSIIILSFFIVNEIVIIAIYRWFISKEVEGFFTEFKEDDYSLNPYMLSLLTLPRGYISKHWSIFSLYEIYGVGVVPRWSKLHKKINEYYKIAWKNYLKTN